ncbi:50S ribosomal protein L10 [Tunturibacter empetritectus]|uniref:Large ribosomal subunit protein uL10 n=1 Tax=Tunturiibacter lichenicola TaxID=2051959 RepID=A0A7W8N5G2_9BACT|nr:50S ribosomal protein L10 [Edaphobacter lichenicola]MBB5344536.1 large subunit ribosomal protein L10 [Edaphobacter lichenicola]
MALTRASKTEKVKQLAIELEHSTSAIIGTFKGLTAAKDFELRKTVRAAGGNYHVVKNKLAARASEGTKIESALQGLKGVSAVAYTSGDPVALAKALSTWVKDNAEFTFKLGIVDGKVIDVREIGDLATMPGKEELFSKLLFLIQSPAQRLATVINATGRNLAVVINQGVEKGKFAGAPAAPAEAPKAEFKVEETPVAEAKVEEAPVAVAEAPAAEAPAAEGQLVAEAHAVEAPGADATAEQPENSTASQGGEAATTDPVEG